MDQEKVMRSKLFKVKNRLDQARISWVVFAGAGSYCYGGKRKITDVDILLRCEDLEKAKATLKDIGTQGIDIV